MISGVNLVQDKVKFDGVPLDKLIKKFGTPFFLFSEKRLIDNYHALSAAFQKYYRKTSIYYSVKTNFEPQILKTLRSQGSRGEIASALEVLLAQKAGFDASELIIDGPAWNDQEIAFCIKKGVAVFNVDSLDLLARVAKIAQKLDIKVNISFRIYPELKMSILKSFIEGYISKFGIPISQAVDAYSKALSYSHVQPMAISSHIGSMITDPSYYQKSIERLVTLAARLRDQLGLSIKTINIGGGYGLQSLNYYSLQNIILNKAGISQYSKAPSIEEFGKKIGTKFREMLNNYHLPEIELVLEPGRFLVSDTGILVTRVVAVKKDWIFIDGGINLVPESIFFIRRGFIIANKAHRKPTRRYNIAGPTLNTADVLATDQKLPEMAVGDIVLVLDAGAYSLTRSNQFTILRPVVVFVSSNQQIKIIRQAETPNDLLNKLLL
ncbi:alanine racemase [Candidatus Daviesbacteria bacterium]|nr:alanine racemase [Candidatus Daviesbacteria bacterium]